MDLKSSLSIRVEQYDPNASNEAIVLHGKARFTVLTEALIRMEWADDGVFEDRPSLIFVNRRADPPPFTAEEIPAGVRIRTKGLQLEYRPAESGKFTPQSLQGTFFFEGAAVPWRYGDVEKANLGGTNRSLDFWLGDRVYLPDESKARIANFEEMKPGLLSRDGWTVIDDSKGYLFEHSDFSLGQQGQPWVASRAPGDRQDLYLFAYGRRYRELLQDYIRFAGPIALPPRYAFGIWYSKYAIYSDQEVLDLAAEYAQRKTPLSVFVLDLEWHKAYIERWLAGETDQSGGAFGFGGFSWNRNLFPDPAAFLGEMHRLGIRVTLNLHPSYGVQPTEERYPEMARAMGMDPAEGKYVPLDIADRNFAQHFMEIMHRPSEEMGVDFWWVDHIRGDDTSLPGLQNVFWMNYVYFTDMAMQGKRPMIFLRWGGLGSHRYPIQFSGDTFTAWETLHTEIEFTARSANVGAAYWSHDLGGHQPGKVEGELYARWMQFGLYSPVMRSHVCKNPDAERIYWKYPDPYCTIMWDALMERNRLLPYLYSEARQTYESGLAFVHPLYIEWPELEEAYEYAGEYCFGRNLIVAPIDEKACEVSRMTPKSVWIPPGSWYERTLGLYLQGPCVWRGEYLLDETPVLQKAGSIVPIQPTDTTDRCVIGLRLAPCFEQNREIYALYEDSGEGRDYQTKDCATTLFEADWDENGLTLTIEPVEGGFPGMPGERSCHICLEGCWPAETVCVDGLHLKGGKSCDAPGFWYDGARLETVIKTPPLALAGRHEIRVRWNPGLVGHQTALHGIIGAMRRIKATYDTVNLAFPIGFPADSLTHSLQLGRRITLHPESILAQLQDYRQTISQTMADVERQPIDGVLDPTVLAQRMVVSPDSPDVPARREKGLRLLEQAKALARSAKDLLSTPGK